LLELLVVLCVTALLTGMVTVSIAPTLEEARLRAGTRMVIAALQYARSHAVAQQTDAMVRFDRERSGVSVHAHEFDDAGAERWRAVTTPAGRFRPLPDGVTVARVVREEVTPQDEDATVTFTPLGHGEEVGITLRNARGLERVVLVDAVTGRCALAEDEP
jgi:Tfp pilus assembly protein FimT